MTTLDTRKINTIITKEYYSLRGVLAAMEQEEVTHHSSSNPGVKVKMEANEVTCQMFMQVEMTRPAYSSVGYAEGTEVCIFAVPILDHDTLFEDTRNIMFEIDPCVVDFNNAKVADMWSPEEYGDDEGYFPPDEDFWWDEFMNVVVNPVVNALEKGDIKYEFSKEHPHDGSAGRFWLFTGDPDFVYNNDAPDPCGARENLLYTELP